MVIKNMSAWLHVESGPVCVLGSMLNQNLSVCALYLSFTCLFHIDTKGKSKASKVQLMVLLF
jgi:hypothetical protein